MSLDDVEITRKLELFITQANTKRADEATQEGKVTNIAKDMAAMENSTTSPVDPTSRADQWPPDYRQLKLDHAGANKKL